MNVNSFYPVNDQKNKGQMGLSFQGWRVGICV